MKLLPSTLNEFKNNKYYTLESSIKKYQGIMPSAKPLEGMDFKGDLVYLKKDLTELHTVERWKTHQRKVNPGEAPFKRVKGLYNDPERMAELYGYWQTSSFRTSLTHDGKIPVVSDCDFKAI